MKKQKIMALFSIMLLVIGLTGCSKAPGFTVGKWNEKTFENKWLNMKFDVPADWQIATKEEINEMIGAGAELLDIEGTSAEQLKAASDLKTIYAFVATNSNGLMIQLMFENMKLTIGASEFTAAEYLDELLGILLTQENLEYKLIEKGSKKIADKEFQSVNVSAFGGAVFQEYYAYKMDKFMVAIIVSYAPEQESLKEDFMNGIRVLK